MLIIAIRMASQVYGNIETIRNDMGHPLTWTRQKAIFLREAR